MCISTRILSCLLFFSWNRVLCLLASTLRLQSEQKGSFHIKGRLGPRIFLPLFSFFCLFLTSPCQAREMSFSPDPKETLLQLATYLGELHYLTQLCEMPSPWRMRMAALLEAQASNLSFQNTLREYFNTGYQAISSVHRNCTPTAQRLRKLSLQNLKESALFLLEKRDSLSRGGS